MATRSRKTGLIFPHKQWSSEEFDAIFEWLKVPKNRSLWNSTRVGGSEHLSKYISIKVPNSKRGVRQIEHKIRDLYKRYNQVKRCKEAAVEAGVSEREIKTPSGGTRRRFQLYNQCEEVFSEKILPAISITTTDTPSAYDYNSDSQTFQKYVSPSSTDPLTTSLTPTKKRKALETSPESYKTEIRSTTHQTFKFYYHGAPKQTSEEPNPKIISEKVLDTSLPPKNKPYPEVNKNPVYNEPIMESPPSNPGFSKINAAPVETTLVNQKKLYSIKNNNSYYQKHSGILTNNNIDSYLPNSSENITSNISHYSNHPLPSTYPDQHTRNTYTYPKTAGYAYNGQYYTDRNYNLYGMSRQKSSIISQPNLRYSNNNYNTNHYSYPKSHEGSGYYPDSPGRYSQSSAFLPNYRNNFTSEKDYNISYNPHPYHTMFNNSHNRHYRMPSVSIPEVNFQRNTKDVYERKSPISQQYGSNRYSFDNRSLNVVDESYEYNHIGYKSGSDISVDDIPTPEPTQYHSKFFQVALNPTPNGTDSNKKRKPNTNSSQRKYTGESNDNLSDRGYSSEISRGNSVSQLSGEDTNKNNGIKKLIVDSSNKHRENNKEKSLEEDGFINRVAEIVFNKINKQLEANKNTNTCVKDKEAVKDLIQLKSNPSECNLYEGIVQDAKKLLEISEHHKYKMNNSESELFELKKSNSEPAFG
ncbi:hypothetical protein BB558_000355 [Smittium angustum]|uniref:Uncharacterized protein n=1 Tax=Smittium angustum TaxID=133377 RepID=A0A2U1JEF9_SMIAN|nr:hypothetical protein BB558_000355 [Smittium angustum]